MNFKIENGDCIQQLKKLPDNSVDIILTDLPYGTLTKTKNNENKTDTVYKVDWDGQLNYDLLVPEMLRVIKPNRAIVLFAQAPFTFNLYQNLTKHGAIWRNNWIWDKCSAANFACAKFMPLKNFEQIMIFYKQDKSKKRTVAYYPQGVKDLQPVLVKCRFYSKSTGEPIAQDKVWDEVIIPYLFLNLIGTHGQLNIKDISCITTPDSCSKKTVSNTRYSLDKLLGDINYISNASGISKETSTFRRSGIPLVNLLKNTGVISDRNERKLLTSSESSGYSLDTILEDIAIVAVNTGNKHKTSTAICSNDLNKLLGDIAILCDRSGTITQSSAQKGYVSLENLLQTFYKCEDGKLYLEREFYLDFNQKKLMRKVQGKTGYPKSIITFSNVARKSKYPHHQTQKCTDILEYLIKTYSLEGETVLDMTMGSGSTGVACVNTNRNFIGFELLKSWYDVAESRINDAIKEKEQCKKAEEELN